MNKRAVGNKGEAIAVKWLKENQFEIVTQNYYTPYGELDIVAQKSGIFYFIEVKYRRSLKYGDTKEALTHKKITNLKRSVLHYIKSQRRYLEYRVSFIGIKEIDGLVEIEWLENIFE